MDLLQDRTMGQSEGDKGQELLSLARGKRKRISVLKALFCAFLLIFLFICARVAVLELLRNGMAERLSYLLLAQGLGMPN